MSNEVFSNLFDSSPAVPAAIVKANQLAVAHVEKLVGLQFAALQYYADLGFDRLKSAAKVSNSKEWQEFLSDQTQVIGHVNQRVVEDAKALYELSKTARLDYESLVKDVIETAPGTLNQVAEKVVKETAETVEENVA